MKIRHIGIAVESIKERLPMWESLGLKLDHTEEVESEGVTTAPVSYTHLTLPTIYSV